MAEQMTKEQLDFQERFNSGTSPTNNEQFDRDGYLILKIYGIQKIFIVIHQKLRDNITIMENLISFNTLQ